MKSRRSSSTPGSAASCWRWPGSLRTRAPAPPGAQRKRAVAAVLEDMDEVLLAGVRAQVAAVRSELDADDPTHLALLTQRIAPA